MKLRSLALAALITTAAATAAHAAAIPADGELDFTVLRDGEEIGTHVLRFASGTDGNLDVDVATDIAVEVMFVTVYRFEHQGHEHWQDGRLFTLTSTTDDDGEAHDLVVNATGDTLAVADNGAAEQRPGDLLPASLWNDGIVAGERTTLLNTLDGSAMDVSVEYLGDEQVEGEDGPVAARHYRLTGDLARELWYDQQGVLVKVRFSGEDGSDIQYVLR